MLRAFWDSFRDGELGQDLSEYCLIVALVALVGLGIFVQASGGIQSIWADADASFQSGARSGPAGSTAPTGGR